MTSSTQKFLQWFYEYYYHEYPNISFDEKKDIIQDRILNNAQYITKDMVIAFDGCNKCGRCCEQQGCLDYDKETKLCKRHDDPISWLCTAYPWTGEDFGIAPLTLNCHFQVAFFVSLLDKVFEDMDG